MSFSFFKSKDNTLLLQAVFDRDTEAVKKLLSSSDLSEGNGRVLQVAIKYSTLEISKIVLDRTPNHVLHYSFALAVEYNKDELGAMIAQRGKFSNGALKEIELAFDKSAYFSLEHLFKHANLKRDGELFISKIRPQTPLAVVSSLQNHMGNRLCSRLPLSVWPLAGQNPKGFLIFAPYLDLKKMHSVVCKKTYTRLTKDSQDLIETLLTEKGVPFEH